jgi:NADPH:quinone reductase
MRAFTLDSFDAPPALRDDLPTPSPADDELLVRVHASAVNPVDAGIGAGQLKDMVEHEFPTVHEGSWAELIVVPDNNEVAPKPASVEPEAAGAAPLSGITALLSVDALDVSEDDTVLVVGATGGVGSFAVQLLVHAGATVIAPALPEDEEYLRGLGVSEPLDRNVDTTAAVREGHPDGVDALLDLVSYTPDDFDANAAALKPGGRGASPVSAAGDGPGRTNVMAVPSLENLERLAQVLDSGILRVHIQNSYPLEQAGNALEALGATHTQGKLGIQVAS